MPLTVTARACSLAITSVMPSCRSWSGFRLICSRPLLGVVFIASTPMNEDRLSTAGSWSSACVNACCLSASAVNDVVCGASVMPRMTPVS
jgi:hypothetical protein